MELGLPGDQLREDQVRPSDIRKRLDRFPGLFRIVQEAATAHFVTWEALLGRGRSKSVAAARHEAITKISERTGWSNVELAGVFGVHATTIRDARKAHHERTCNPVQESREEPGPDRGGLGHERQGQGEAGDRQADPARQDPDGGEHPGEAVLPGGLTSPSVVARVSG